VRMMANGTDHQSLGDPAMGRYSLAILADRSEIDPCQPRQVRGPFKGRDRSPQRSVRMMANGTDHQSLGDPAMGRYSLAILADRSEIGPCQMNAILL
jgi:hypothetical protein